MGVIVSLFGGGTGRTDDPNPVTGLTSRDVYLIQSTWADIRKEPTKNGVAILIAFLQKYPKYKQLFPFKDVPDSDLPNDKKFQAHCNSVIYALNSVVDNLNDPEIVINLAKKVGRIHKGNKVPVQAFGEIEQVIADTLKQMVSHEAHESWKKALKVLTSLFIKGHSDG